MKPKLFEEMGFAKIDHHRAGRCGAPEAIYYAGKTPEQVGRCRVDWLLRFLSFCGK